MKHRKNVRKLIQQYNAASAADKPNTPLMKFRNAIVALKAAPSQLAPPHTQANRYDDYVYVHQQSMAGHPSSDDGPHAGHKGPLFFPWHREFLRHFENDLRAVSGDASICLPYWDFATDQQAADAGYPFFDEFLGGDGTGPGNEVQTGAFAFANGWTLNLGGSDRLQRDFANSQAPTLPTAAAITAALAETTYDSAPFNRTVAGSDSFRNLVEGWVGPQSGANVHNRVHVWVGGSMLPATSPNDPVFFLNHAKEDELWAVWMQKHPTVPHYLPDDSYTLPAGHTHLKRLSDHMENLAEYFGAGTLDRPIDLLDHKAIAWYDTDLPEITLESGPAIAFNDTPEGLTVAKHARFRIHSPRTVFFSITGAPSGNFSVVGGPDFSVIPIEANDSEILEIEVRFHGVGPDVQVSAVDIEARILDEEGYYAANPGDAFVVKTFHLELVANDIVTSDSSVVLVLDRSGSMADVANSGFTKSELLKSAVGVVHELMKSNDQIGMARFDHEADVLLPMTPKSAGLGTVLTGPGLDPRGATSIGGGILIGSGLINGPGATHPNKAMIVLSDGNENAAPKIPSLPAGTINQTTFAIGFGLPGQVSDAVLDQISANSGGYLLVTGDMTSDAERFALAKFFIQILKDATLNQTVLDPQGQMLWNGQPQEIAFQVADSDVSIDVVALSPLPFAVDFRLITPGGQVITQAMSGVEPNVRYHLGVDVAYYRVLLPALPSYAGTSHRGTWKAVLRLRPVQEIVEILRDLLRKDRPEFRQLLTRVQEFARKPLPYNLTVHSYSNLTLAASLRQQGFAPGDAAHLSATLWEYQAPLSAPATVWAEVVQPNGVRSTLAFTHVAGNEYRARWVTSLPGVYRFVVHAEGYTSANGRFTREKVLTASVWVGGDRPFDPLDSGDGGGGTHPGGTDDMCCKTLLCLLEKLLASPAIQERCKALGIEPSELRRCLQSKVRPSTATATVPHLPTDLSHVLAHLPELSQLLASFTTAGLKNMDVLEAGKVAAVKRRPKMEVGDENMFLMSPQNQTGKT